MREAIFVGLSLNIKPNIIWWPIENHEKGDLFVEGKKLERVDDLKYLGTFLKSCIDDFPKIMLWEPNTGGKYGKGRKMT
jgi:hypothetical protein